MPRSKKLPAFPPASARYQRGSTGSREWDSTGPRKRIPCGFDTTWLAWLDETEPDCPGCVTACWLERVGLDGAKGTEPCGFDTTWLAWLDETEPDCPGCVTACWLERVGLDGAKEADPCGFDTTWLAWLDETEPDCPGCVTACWLERVGLDGAREAEPCGFDTTWLAWLDETEPDCPGCVTACWLERVGLDGAKEAEPSGSIPPGLPGSTKPSPTAPAVSPPAGSREWDSTGPGMARGRSYPRCFFPACSSGNAIRRLRPRQPRQAARRRFRSQWTNRGPRMLGSSPWDQLHACGTESHHPPD